MITEEALRLNKLELQKGLRAAEDRKRRALQIYSEAETAVHRAGADISALQFSLECVELVESVIRGDDAREVRG